MNITRLTITENPEKHIEYCSRICYDSQDKSTPDSYQKLIRSLIKNGHHSTLEHASASFLIDGVSRACTHQLVRHRMASFSQQSQRYVKEDQFDYVTPPDVAGIAEAQALYSGLMLEIQNVYNRLTELGVKKEDARFVLPNAATTQISMTANFREWLHVIDLRVSLHAQWEIRNLLTLIWRNLYRAAPSVFGLTFFEFWSKDYEWKKAHFENHVLPD